MAINKTTIASLRHRITFQSLALVSDGLGGFTETWANVDSNPEWTWAKVEPVSSRERVYAQQVEYQRSHKAIIRYRSDITQEMRVLFDGRVFQVKGTYSPDERRAYLFIDLEENQGT